jgi:hypothetical protein
MSAEGLALVPSDDHFAGHSRGNNRFAIAAHWLRLTQPRSCVGVSSDRAVVHIQEGAQVTLHRRLDNACPSANRYDSGGRCKTSPPSRETSSPTCWSGFPPTPTTIVWSWIPRRSSAKEAFAPAGYPMANAPPGSPPCALWRSTPKRHVERPQTLLDCLATAIRRGYSYDPPHFID